MDQERALEADRLSQAMKTTRAAITDTVGELRENVNRAVDWREHVKTHSATALGAAAVGGILLGHWLGAKIAARTPSAGAPSSAGAAEHAPRGGMLLNGSLTRAGSRFSDLVNRVIDELGDTVEKAAIPPLIARFRGILQPGPKGTDASPMPRQDPGRFEEPGVSSGWPAGRQAYSPHASQPPRA